MSASRHAVWRWRYGAGLVALTLVLGAVALPAAPPPQPLLLDAALAADGAIVAVGGRGTVLRSTDAGRTWQRTSNLPYTAFTGVSFAPDRPARGWAVGHEDVILTTADAGRTWIHARAATDPERSFLDVLALDARRVIAVGAFGLYLSSRDGGQTWRSRTIMEEDLHLNRLTRADDGTLYLAGEAGTLLRSTDEGESWKDIATDYPGSFFGVLTLSDGVVIAYGLRGTLYRSEDRGDSWEELPVVQPVILQAAAASPGGRLIMAGGQARTLLISRDGGQSFALSPRPPPTAVAKILPLNDGTWLAFGEGGVSRLPLP